MGIFDIFTNRLVGAFRKAPKKTRDLIGFGVGCAGTIPLTVEDSFIPVIERLVGITLDAKCKKALTHEISLAISGCGMVPDSSATTVIFGCPPEFLPEFVAIVMLAKSNDSRTVLEKTGYSRNLDEARVQVIMKAADLLDGYTDKVAERLQSPTFAKEWYGLSSTVFINLFTIMRQNEARMVKRIEQELATANPQVEAVVMDLIRRM